MFDHWTVEEKQVSAAIDRLIDYVIVGIADIGIAVFIAEACHKLQWHGATDLQFCISTGLVAIKNSGDRPTAENVYARTLIPYGLHESQILDDSCGEVRDRIWSSVNRHLSELRDIRTNHILDDIKMVANFMAE